MPALANMQSLVSLWGVCVSVLVTFDMLDYNGPKSGVTDLKGLVEDVLVWV